MKFKKEIKFANFVLISVVILFFGLIFIVGCGDNQKLTKKGGGADKTTIQISEKEQNVPSSGIELDISLSKPLGLGETGIITTTITSIVDLKNAEVKILLPDGFDLLEGDLLWKGDIIIPEEEKEKHPLPPTDCSGPECERMWKEYTYPSAQIKHQITIKAVKEGNWTIEGVLNKVKRDFIYISVLEDNSIIYNEPFPIPAEPCKDVYLDGKLIRCTIRCPPDCDLINQSCFCTK